MLELTACEVERDEENNYLLRWVNTRPGREVCIYIAENAEQFYSSDKSAALVARTAGSTALVTNPDTSKRHFFLLDFGDGHSLVVAERRILLSGASNFRDLGGFEAADGRRLKWGRIYRSGKLSKLTEADIKYVRLLNVTLVCDFRQEIEQAMDPTVLGENTTHVIANLPIMPGSSQSFLDNLHTGIVDLVDSAAFMESLNRELVATQMPQYARMFKLLLEQPHTLLIHCAAGKDRTGFGAALLLDILGVGEDEIVADYMLTNACLTLEEEMERLSSQVRDSQGNVVNHDVLRPLLEVRPEYILACFEEIGLRYGSKEQFYESALGLDASQIAWLRDSYLH